MTVELLKVHYVLHEKVGPNPPGVYESREPKSVDEVGDFLRRWLPAVAAHPVHEILVSPASLGERRVGGGKAAEPPRSVTDRTDAPDLVETVHLILSTWWWRHHPW